MYEKKGANTMEGIIVVNKEAGMTSHDVVGKLRRILKTKRIGHAGTLDPMATGVLVLGVGRGTKLLQFLSADTKIYRATLKLGVATTTYDCEGDITAQRAYQNDLTLDQIKAVLNSFLGDSMQVPPIYSAIKKNGKPLYKYARQNETVEIAPRPIHISKIELLSFEKDEVTFEVICSKGTYIRSLCVDIASKLGYPGMMSALVRVQSGIYDLSMAYSLANIEAGDYQMIDIDEALKGMERLVVADAKMIYDGKKIKSEINKQVAVYDSEGHLLAVYEPDGQGYLKSVRGLW